MTGKMKETVNKSTPTIVTGIICLVIALLILIAPSGKKGVDQTELSEYSSVSAICELATLRSFYHNVVVYEKEPDGVDKFFNDVMIWPFGGLVKKGYKQFWMEYSGIVETGIDANKIQINKPNANGIVDVYVPDARILHVYADQESLSDPISEKGLFTTISAKEKINAFAKAQSAMQDEAENDQTLLQKTKNNAKQLLKQYIVNTGKEMGVEYSVNWIDTNFHLNHIQSKEDMI